MFADMNACIVLDNLAAGRGFDPGENKSSRNQCNATGDDITVGLALDPVQGLGAFRKSEQTTRSITINDREALAAPRDYGQCSLALKVGPSERAVVYVTLDDTDADACPKAREYAEKLEPELPTVG